MWMFHRPSGEDKYFYVGCKQHERRWTVTSLHTMKRRYQQLTLLMLIITIV